MINQNFTKNCNRYYFVDRPLCFINYSHVNFDEYAKNK